MCPGSQLPPAKRPEASLCAALHTGGLRPAASLLFTMFGRLVLPRRWRHHGKTDQDCSHLGGDGPSRADALATRQESDSRCFAGTRIRRDRQSISADKEPWAGLLTNAVAQLSLYLA